MLDRVFLGIEGGGTRMIALAADAAGRQSGRIQLGPSNLRLIDDRELRDRFAQVRQFCPRPVAIGIAFAGVRTDEDRQRLRSIADRIWPAVPKQIDHDLVCALAAADAGLPGDPRVAAGVARVLILSGTGSCCFGDNPRGETAKSGGWGHLLGDRGSAYEISLRIIRDAVVQAWDHSAKPTALSGHLLRELCLASPEQLVEWIQSATKSEIAGVLPGLLREGARDSRVRSVLADSMAGLAADAFNCADKLGFRRRPVRFVLAGGVLSGSRLAAQSIEQTLGGLRRVHGDHFELLQRETAWGTLQMAFGALRESGSVANSRRHGSANPVLLHRDRASPIPSATAPSPTEIRNPKTLRLDQMTVPTAIDCLLDEEATVAEAVRSQRGVLTRLISEIVRSFRRGGRLFYVGAGTSGRLGVLDASECPPTFRSAPEQVQGIMAGGSKALWSAVEGAEDDVFAGGQAIALRGVRGRDVVIGIAASGRTPFVWGALAEARKRKARIALICCNPNLKFQAGMKPDHVVSLPTGAEALTGSTRLKAGTATKVTLNVITTLAMVRMGKVISNLMVDLNPSNKKLRERAVRMAMELTGLAESEVENGLNAMGWKVHPFVMAAKKRKLRKRAW